MAIIIKKISPRHLNIKLIKPQKTLLHRPKNILRVSEINIISLFQNLKIYPQKSFHSRQTAKKLYPKTLWLRIKFLVQENSTRV